VGYINKKIKTSLREAQRGFFYANKPRVKILKKILLKTAGGTNPPDPLYERGSGTSVQRQMA
jgi:hypothetical protein